MIEDFQSSAAAIRSACASGVQIVLRGRSLWPNPGRSNAITRYFFAARSITPGDLKRWRGRDPGPGPLADTSQAEAFAGYVQGRAGEMEQDHRRKQAISGVGG